MPRFGPIKRQDLIRYLRRVGFAEPYSGGRHQFMVSGDVTIWIPNPHQGDIGRELLSRILRQAHISREAWEKLWEKPLTLTLSRRERGHDDMSKPKKAA